jgi:hypothetical protein
MRWTFEDCTEHVRAAVRARSFRFNDHRGLSGVLLEFPRRRSVKHSNVGATQTLRH